MGMETEGVPELFQRFLRKNYNYYWLKTRLERGKRIPDSANATLITGSSHALNGIWENAWTCALNCSMHSQDLYYDFRCAKEVIRGKSGFQRCFILFGYYIACQDLSLSKGMRDYMVSPVYYPIFGDAHHWEKPEARDQWKDFEGVSEKIRRRCEAWSQQAVSEEPTYYSRFRRRKPFFDFGGRAWWELTEEEQENYGRQRAEGHNSILKYEESFYENRQILKDYVHFLYLNHVRPVVVIPPFTAAYNRHIDGRLREAVTKLVEGPEEELSFVDFNMEPVFDNYDFVDMDHLNEQGAVKMSRILAERFGK